MPQIHLVMPMAGRGSRFANMNFLQPKPLISIYNKPFFYWSIQSIYKFINISSLDIIVLEEHVRNYSIDKEILEYYPNARVHIIDKVTEGAVVTALHGISKIDDKYPIIFNDCDHLFKSEKLNEFCKISSDLDGLLITFKSSENKYSYAAVNADGYVVKTAEKIVISNLAICGCYYFKNADIFKKMASIYLENCQYNEFFMSGIYNTMLENEMKVKTMPTDFHVPFGTPDEYMAAQADEHYKGLI